MNIKFLWIKKRYKSEFIKENKKIIKKKLKNKNKKCQNKDQMHSRDIKIFGDSTKQFTRMTGTTPNTLF